MTSAERHVRIGELYDTVASLSRAIRPMDLSTEDAAVVTAMGKLLFVEIRRLRIESATGIMEARCSCSTGTASSPASGSSHGASAPTKPLSANGSGAASTATKPNKPSA